MIKRRNQQQQMKKRNNMNLTEWTLLSLLTAQMIEVIANIGFILGRKFRSQLVDVFYLLVELTVDYHADIIVRQACASTLKRIAIYMDYNDVYDMLRNNLDYIVDHACIQLRNTVTLGTPSSPSNSSNSNSNSTTVTQVSSSLFNYNYNYRTALVVDAVFSALGNSVFQLSTSSSSDNIRMIDPLDTNMTIQNSFSMLKDMVLDTLDNIDQLAATSSLTQPHTLSLIRVMNVMVYHAIEPKKFTGIAQIDIQEGMIPAQAASTIAWSKTGSSKVFLPSSSSSSSSSSQLLSPLSNNTDKHPEKPSHINNKNNTQKRILNELQRFKTYVMSVLSSSSSLKSSLTASYMNSSCKISSISFSSCFLHSTS